MKINICPNNSHFDPDQNLCVLQLCNMKTINVNYSLMTVTSFKLDYCYYSYAQCRVYETCDSNNNKNNRYLCSEGNKKCTYNAEIDILCTVGNLYDPLTSECVINLCPVMISSLLVEITATNHTETGTVVPTSVTLSPTTFSTSFGSITTTTNYTEQPNDCFASFTKCNIFESCDSSNKKMQSYLCAEAYRKCSSTNQSVKLCNTNDYYSPNSNLCVVQLCPIKTTEILVTGVITIGNAIYNGSHLISINGSVVSSTTNETDAIETGNIPLPATSISSITESSITGSTVECFSSYAQCKEYEYCTDNNITGRKYLCVKAFNECSNDESQEPLCSDGQLYDPNEHSCILKLCTLISKPISIAPLVSTISPLVTIAVASTVSPANISFMPSSNKPISTATEDNIIVTSPPMTDKCFLVGGYCRLYNVCNNNRNFVYYLCSNATAKCALNGQIISLCKENSLYDPDSKNCVAQLCPFDSTSTVINSEKISSAVIAEGSKIKNITDTDMNTYISNGCYTTISKCSIFDTCDVNGFKEKRFLCSTATTTCTKGNMKINICPNNSNFDPDQNLCVLQLCNMKTINVNYSLMTVTSFKLGYCYYSYAQCRVYETCDSNNNKNSRYLCSVGNKKCTYSAEIEILCAIENFYDPFTNDCVLNLCPISVFSNITTISEMIETTALTASNSTSFVNGSGVSSGMNFDNSSQVNECFSTYAKCQNLETCDSQKNKATRYLCVDAFKTCTSVSQLDRLCYVNNYYDPNDNVCFVQLCPVITSSVLVTLSIVNKGNFSHILPITSTETISTFTVGIPTTTTMFPKSNLTDVSETTDKELANECFSSYAQCREYVICLTNQTKANKYLCGMAYNECLNDLSRAQLCSDGHLYDPDKHECVIRLCVFVTTPVSMGTSITAHNVSITVGAGVENTSATSTDGNNNIGTISLPTIGVVSTAGNISTATINNGNSSANESAESSVATTSSSSLHECKPSYSNCRLYKVCESKLIQNNRYLCIVTYQSCTYDSITETFCGNNSLFDPTTNECVLQLCPVNSIPVQAIMNTTIVESAVISIYNASANETSIASISTTVNPIIVTVNESIEQGNSSACLISYSNCRSLEICNSGNVKAIHYLCTKAFKNCTSMMQAITLCRDTDYFDPNTNECISQLCPFTTSSLLESATETNQSGVPESSSAFDAGIGKPVKVTSNSTTQDILLVESGNTTFSSFNSSFGDGSSEINGTSITTFNCYSSYAKCQEYKICNSAGETMDAYFCFEAYYICSGGSRSINICNGSALYDPHNKNCIPKLCPLETIPVEHTENDINASDDASETVLNNQTVSEFAIGNPESINYTEVVFCQLKYDFCKNVYNYNKINSLINAKYLCQCQETCYFRKEKLHNLFLCYPPLFEVESGTCSFSGDKENCMIGSATSSLLDGGNSFSRFRESLNSAIESQGSYISRFRSKFADLSLESSRRMCSEPLQRPKSYWIQKRFCSDIASCVNKEKLQLWRVKSLCTHYVECALVGDELTLSISSCPDNQFYSYDDDQCVENNFRTDICALFMGGEPSSSILRLFSERLPFRAKTFLNTRLIGL